MTEKERVAVADSVERNGSDAKGTSEPVLTLMERPRLHVLQIAAWPSTCAEAARIIGETCGLRPPMERNTTANWGALTILTIAPGTWLAATDAGDSASRLVQVLSADVATVVDSGAGRRVLRLAGSGSRDVLAKLLPLDLTPSRFPVDACAGSVMAHTGVLVHAVAADAFDIFVYRSFAQYLAEVIVDSGLEFGIRR
jgi:heterotetrameric sarcosine oxidase gamma subunit